MRRWAVIAGIVIFLFGVGLILNFKSPMQVSAKSYTENAEGTWSVSDYFREGQKLYLRVDPAPDWRLYPFFPELEGIQYGKVLNVTIRNTVSNTYSSLEVVYGFPPGYRPEPPYLDPILMVATRSTHNGSLVMEDPSDYPSGVAGAVFGGLVKEEGLYKVDTLLMPNLVFDTHLVNQSRWIHNATAPRLILWKITNETTYPYGFLLPVGGSLSFFGTITFLWGMKGGGTVRKSRLRKMK